MSNSVSINRLTSVVSRGASPAYSDSGAAKFINQACVYWSGIKESAIKLADETAHQPGSRGYIEKGDILVNSTGTGTLGRSTIFNKDNDGSYFADSHVTIVRPIPGVLSSRYANYAFQTDSFQDKIYTFCVSGSTNQIELSRERFRDLELNNIDFNEQEKLADYLDTKTQTLDKILTAKNYTHTHLSELRQAIVTNELFDGGRSDTMKVQLRRVATLQTIKQNAVADVPIITLENVESWTGRLFGYTEHESVSGELVTYKKGDVLFNKLRPYLAKVHVAEHDGLCTGEMLVLRPKTGQIDPRYLFYFLVSNKTISDVSVATYGVKMPRANWETIGSLEIDLPSLDEQRKIVVKLDSKLAKIDKADATLQKSISQLEEYRSSLISNVVGGKVEI